MSYSAMLRRVGFLTLLNVMLHAGSLDLATIFLASSCVLATYLHQGIFVQF
jgi:hypothetical protein